MILISLNCLLQSKFFLLRFCMRLFYSRLYTQYVFLMFSPPTERKYFKKTKQPVATIQTNSYFWASPKLFQILIDYNWHFQISFYINTFSHAHYLTLTLNLSNTRRRRFFACSKHMLSTISQSLFDLIRSF